MSVTMRVSTPFFLGSSHVRITCVTLRGLRPTGGAPRIALPALPLEQHGMGARHLVERVGEPLLELQIIGFARVVGTIDMKPLERCLSDGIDQTRCLLRQQRSDRRPVDHETAVYGSKGEAEVPEVNEHMHADTQWHSRGSNSICHLNGPENIRGRTRRPRGD
jgi:hypothetical protein